jgi:hypothetical protein
MIIKFFESDLHYGENRFEFRLYINTLFLILLSIFAQIWEYRFKIGHSLFLPRS